MYLSSEIRKNNFLRDIKLTNELIWVRLEKWIIDLKFWTEQFNLKVKEILAENRSQSSLINKIIADILRKNGIY
jgi:hypothetical protein